MQNRILILSIFFSLFLFSSISFAQNFDDIGSLIFRDLLQMREYPGAPFTGNIMEDLIMFLLVPSVFIIIIIYTLTGRLVANAKLDLLLSVTLYLFIIAGGYYRAFALLAGPYFIFLIFILGLIYFFAGHFGFRAGGGYSGGRGGGYGATGTAGRYAHYEQMSFQELNVAKDRVQKDLKAVDQQLKEASRKGSTETHLENLRTRKADLEGELEEIKTLLNVVKRQTRKFGLR